MREQILKISDVYIDDKIYPRESFSQMVVNQYKKDMKFGSVFPNIWVAKFKGKYYLVDGLHRIRSKEQLGEEFIKADIQENLKTKLDIYLASIRANLRHGKTLSHKDRIKVAKQLKNMKVDIDSISKLLHIGGKDLEKVGLTTTKDIQRLMVTQKNFTSILRDKKVKQALPNINGSKEEPIKIMSPEDEQYAQLNAFLCYLKDIELLHNKLNRTKLVAIVKEIKRTLARMRK